jgi:hypothetical protein
MFVECLQKLNGNLLCRDWRFGQVLAGSTPKAEIEDGFRVFPWRG